MKRDNANIYIISKTTTTHAMQSVSSTIVIRSR